MTTFAAVTTLRTTASRPDVRGWIVAATVYLLAVFHRSSLGVAGLLAEQRFGITAAQLGAFVLLQIGVYAAMQVPTGVLVDRYGPRRLLLCAAALMALGQLLFAVAPSYPLALLARGLLGCGDAMTFISVLRFAARQVQRAPLPGAAVDHRHGRHRRATCSPPCRWRSCSATSAGRRASCSPACLSAVSGAIVWALLDDGAAAAEPVAARPRGARRDRVGVQAGGRRLVAAGHPARVLGALRAA